MILTRLDRRAAFNSAYFFGFFFNAFSLYWIAPVTPPGCLAAILVVAFYYAFVLYFFHLLYHWRHWAGLIALPLLWVGMEYARTLTEFAFPWSDLGYTQSYYLYILQIVSLISVHGLSLCIVVVNILLWQVLRKELSVERRMTCAFASLAMVVALTAYGWIEMPPYPREGHLTVALLQGNIPLEDKWGDDNEDFSYRVYDSLTQAVTDRPIDLFVWPETAAPAYLSHNAEARQRVADIVRRSDCFHLVGGMGAGFKRGETRYFNSAYQVSPAGSFGERYDKVKLVPFTEQSPYQDYLPFLRGDVIQKYLTFIRTLNVNWWSNFYPGDSSAVFRLKEHNFGVLICFESAFPDFSREMILKGADFLVGITNDTWFGTSVGTHMHSRIFLTRAVENRCWMARAANSGITYIVDPYGRIREELPMSTAAVLTGKVDPIDGFSVFTRIGDLVGKVSLLISALIMGILFILWLVRKFRTFAA